MNTISVSTNAIAPNPTAMARVRRRSGSPGHRERTTDPSRGSPRTIHESVVIRTLP
jgi:hypothetical protein